MTSNTDTWVDEKGRTRRGTNPNATPAPTPQDSTAVEVKVEVKDFGSTPPPEPPKPKTKAKATTKTAAKPTKKETPVSPKTTKGRQAGISYDAPTIAGLADEAPVNVRSRPSIYAPIIEQIVKTNNKAKGKWTLINPEGRKLSSFRSAITQAAGKLDPPVKLETSQGKVDGTEMVYVRVKKA